MELLTEFEIQHLSPLHPGYPEWPGGGRWLQLWQTNYQTQIVITRGLSNGMDHLFEIYIETDDQIDTESFSSSWQANLVYELGKIIPNVNDLSQRLQNNKYLSIQIEIDGAPPEWSLQDENGNIGLFIGLQNPLINQLLTPLAPLNIKLMRPQELIYGIKNDYEGRIKLAELFTSQGNTCISNLERESVV